ncbi:glycosyltransferase [Piscinibacter sakaiensis]|uniref:Glycosyltransferase n=1 Tax=Piscinibacter sakaiensis TaxID=1547922 RepID=A0A0K8P7M6_PISS1|nr:glycosyltransferase [Piscinibacter sakaiensis]GAP38641.1 hypothetical protein ISF6_5194 [Piscinibacter sakaiensis]
MPNATPASPSISVVISTLNRGPLLRNCLAALKYQHYENFEVVVVNGPSTDDSEAVIAAFGDAIKTARIAEANLSKSRNAGIALCDGDIVAFLDDDAYAEPQWLSTIASGYADPSVGGVGTRVYDPSGFAWQTNPFTVDQYYNADFERRPPVWAFEFTDSDTIPHILGASSSFRRDLLHRIGGFDEEIEYFLDESEVCRRIKETGHLIRFLDHGAAVHHKFASGVTRDERKILTYPYPVVKNKFYVCLSDALRADRSVADALQACETFHQGLLADARWHLDHGGISEREFAHFVSELNRGRQDGLERADAAARKSARFPQGPSARGFLRFPTLLPPARQQTFCFVSRYLPATSPGGVARFMFDLAEGFAARGHEVHLITAGKANHVDFRDGLWTHTLGEAEVEAQRGKPPLRSGAGSTNVAWARAAYGEVQRLRETRRVDLVVAPAWDQEGLYCALDRSLPTVVSMNTTFRTYADIERQRLDADTVQELIPLEEQYLRAARYIHANSRATAQHVQQFFGPRGDDLVIVGHGCRDLAHPPPPRPARPPGDASCTLLYLSRLEKRKGTDTFLAALPALLAAHPGLRVRIAGRNAYAGDPQHDHEANFFARHPGLRGRVSFLGEVSDAAAEAEFAQADLFCVPSRYESFGIVYLEAMRHGLPVVACQVGGVPDIVTAEVGLLVPPGQVEPLRQALDRLVADEPLRRAMSTAARQRFTSEFEHQVIVDKTLAAFERLMAGAPAAAQPAPAPTPAATGAPGARA